MEPEATRSRNAAAERAVRVTAVVVTYYTGDSLELCLRSLVSEPCVDEIVLVDNGNPKDVSSALRAFQADMRNVKLVQGHGNVGFAKGCNMGAKLASGRCLLFMNPDVILQRGAVEKMMATGLKGRSPWIVGGRLVDRKGREQRGARRELLTPWRAFVGVTGLTGLEVLSRAFRDMNREKDPKPDGAIAIPVVSGALMMMSKADFESIGGFDEGYFLHVEDVDICRRCGEAGGAVLFEPGAEALHFRSTSRASWVNVERHKARGLKRYFEKFARSPGERFVVAMLSPAIDVALMVRGFGRALTRIGRRSH
jgi:N-acetylglucosaminyl-diphospho-decaprenol L-rhamnosyltransferase